MKYIFALTFVIAAVSAAGDSEVWEAKAEKNALARLDNWKAVVARLQNGEQVKELEAELRPLRWQLRDINNNNEKMVPSISRAIKLVSKLANGNPVILRSLGLRGLLSLVSGRKDSKSYPLLDGAQKWTALRLEALADCNVTICAQLTEKLTSFKGQIVAARDTIKELSEKYATAIKQLKTLTGDFSENVAKVREIADELVANQKELSKFLDDSRNLVKKAKDLVTEYSAKSSE